MVKGLFRIFGMTNIRLELEQYQDLETLNLFRERTAQGYAPEAVMESIWARGRDNARTPMQWDGTAQAGFTAGTPWIAVNPNHSYINVSDAAKDPNSIVNFYRKLIELRTNSEVLKYGDFRLLLPEDPQLFAYRRSYKGEKILICCNFSDHEAAFPFPEGEILLSDGLNCGVLDAYGFAFTGASDTDMQ